MKTSIITVVIYIAAIYILTGCAVTITPDYNAFLEINRMIDSGEVPKAIFSK
jgi:hypothetical protein